MERPASFESAGLTLRGTVHVPDRATGPRPGLIFCHGFGGRSTSPGHPDLARAMERAGYVVLRFDFRGCGESDGERGRLICLEEVEDLRSAITFLEAHPGVDAARIGVIGASLGGSVALYVAAVDPRARVCAAYGAIGNGERRFRYQYPDDAVWAAFLERLEAAKRHRLRTGRSLMIDRFEIVMIPEPLRAFLPPGAAMAFPAETAIGMLEFDPEAIVRRIAPRPLLLAHPRGDPVVPKAESEHLAAAAGEPCELHILETSNHFITGDPTLHAITLEWLARHLPA